MFSTLLSVFNPNKSIVETAYADESNPSFIIDKQKIAILLQQIIEAPPLCTASFRDSSQTFYTSILELQQSKNLLLFDELSPKPGNRLVSQNGSIKLSTFINGVHLSFHLNDVTVYQSGKRIIYQSKIPEMVYYPQRRTSPRIVLDSTAIDFQGTSKDSGMVIKGSVYDISRTGLCISYNKSGNTLLNGDRLTSCLIYLPDDNTFAFDLAVRSVRKLHSNALQKQIGGYFNTLSPQNQHKLDRYVSALERQQIRKRKN